MFPIIKHINDILPHIEDYKEFIVVDKGDYSYCDYVFVDNNSFDNPFRLECRGLIFDKEGNLIRRPLSKFMNLGEKGIFEEHIDWTIPHVITDKMDGSMVAAFNLNGVCRLGTRAGITEHSIKAEKHLTEELQRKLFLCCDFGYTPIFEWCAPTNQIVLSYQEDTLTLLAIRAIETGEYVSRDQLKDFATEWNLPLVKEVPVKRVTDVYSMTGIEGIVVQFENGYTIKVKTEEYVTKHRAVSFLERENMILPVVVANQIDDIMPLLTVDKQEKLLAYSKDVWQEVATLAYRIGITVDGVVESGMSRKIFATEIVAKADERIRSCYFSALDSYGKTDKTTLGIVADKVLKCPDILNTRWKI